jgi:hypothetical protein
VVVMPRLLPAKEETAVASDRARIETTTLI